MGALRNRRILIMLAPPGAQKVPMGPGLKKSHHYHREAIAIIILLTISITIITIAGYTITILPRILQVTQSPPFAH